MTATTTIDLKGTTGRRDSHGSSLYDLHLPRASCTVLRHAESTFNRDGASDYDAPITDDGLERVKEICGEYDYVVVLCMLRAKQTFAASKISGKQVEYSTLCRERISKAPCNLMDGEHDVVETDAEFAFRMNMLKQFLIEKGKSHRRTLVVCHHKVIYALTGKEIENCESVELFSS